MLFFILFSLIFSSVPTNSARILGIVSTPSYSHQVAFRPIWKELSLRGHQVTLLTTDPIKDATLTNLTEIDMSVTYNKWKSINVFELSKSNFFTFFKIATDLGRDITEEQMMLPQVQELIKSTTKSFDLVMIEPLYTSMAAFAEKFDCPLIQVLSLDGSSYFYHLIGNPSHPIVNPDFFIPVTGKLGFFQRLASVIGSEMFNAFFRFYSTPSQNQLTQKHFGKNYSNIEDTLKKTSMLFVNTDLVFHELRPTYPNVVRFGGGTHLTPPKPLPQDLSKQLDNAKHGFIYFSLGSNVKSKELPANVRQIFLDTFAELPYLVLWKFEKDDLPGKPDNVIISKWFPQQDVLRHPNIKLFITQGGLQSTDEAIYSHVPLIGIPFMGDQETNVQKIVAKGMGIHIDRESISKDTLKTAIQEIIRNPTYRNNVKRLANLAKDEPMTGVERAVWWTEYVIRHKGAPHLRSPALDIPFYQYFLLDVIGFCLLVVTVLLYIVYKFSKLTFKILKGIVPYSKLKTQ